LNPVQLQITELFLLDSLAAGHDLCEAGGYRRSGNLRDGTQIELARLEGELQLHRQVAGRAPWPALRDDGAADVERLDLTALAVHPAGDHLGAGFGKSGPLPFASVTQAPRSIERPS